MTLLEAERNVTLLEAERNVTLLEAERNVTLLEAERNVTLLEAGCAASARRIRVSTLGANAPPPTSALNK